MVGIVGRSGAGKSALLRMISRLTSATGGQIVIDGRNVLDPKGAEMCRWQRDWAMIFRQFILVPRLEVVTNVMLGRFNAHSVLKSTFNIFGKDEIEAALRALDRLGIADQALQRAEILSGGQQRRLAIARASMQKPKMVLADEPIASLDPLSAKVVMTALRQIHERDNLTVVCNLHTLDTARTYCDRMIGILHGIIVFDGLPSGLTPAAVRDICDAEGTLNENVTSTAIKTEDSAPPALEPVLEPAGYSMDPGTHFGGVVFTGGHERTIIGVSSGDFDLGVSWADGLGNWEDS